MSYQNKIALGTAQFGMHYGLSNIKGKLQLSEIRSILQFAKRNNIDFLDTAANYGTSEKILGELSYVTANFKISSKFSSSEIVNESLSKTLNKLKRSEIYSYMIHDFTNFNSEIYNELIGLRELNLTTKIGASLYFPAEAITILKSYPELDFVQIPLNIFDQRFIPLLSSLKQRNIEIHTRSTFLQGLFFLDPHSLPSNLGKARDKISALINIAKSSQIPIESLAMLFVLHQKIDKMVIGVTSTTELKGNLEGLSKYTLEDTVYDHLINLRIDDENIILPFNWSNND